MSSAPVFKNTAIIYPVKIALSFLITMTIVAAFWKDQPTIEFHLWYLVLLVMKEFMVGVAIGFAANLVFYAARFAGGIIDFDMGYQTAVMFDPSSTNPTLVGELKELVVIMIFFFINGHHFIIQALFASVRAVPIDVFTVTDSTIELLVRFATSIMIIGVKMSAPILISLFLTNLALALMARVAPQTNIFVLSFQLKIVVGLLVLFASVPIFAMVAKYSLKAMESELLKIILSINPARV